MVKRKTTTKKVTPQAARAKGAAVVARAKARDRAVKTQVAELERELNRSLKTVLKDLRSRSAQKKLTAAEAAQTLGSLYEQVKRSVVGKRLDKLIKEYGAEMAAVNKELRKIDPKLIMSRADENAASALIDFDYETYGKTIEREIGNARSTIMRAVISKSTVDIDKAIDDATPKIRAQIETEANTALSAYNQTLTNARAAAAGLTVFIYLGPEDEKTRDFCQKLIDDGRIFSRDEIERMDNKQGLPVMEAGGGYNCRHQWRPISNKEARAHGFDV